MRYGGAGAIWIYSGSMINLMLVFSSGVGEEKAHSVGIFPISIILFLDVIHVKAQRVTIESVGGSVGLAHMQ